MKCILAIAGSDSCGGAGIQADIKTITSLGAHALTVLTVVTAQNSLGVTAIHKVPARFISTQIETLIEDIVPDAVKIGMVYSARAIKEIARLVVKHKLSQVVVDPVISASTGGRLIEPEAIFLLKEVLLPVANVVTPNLYEAGILAGMKVKDLKGMMESAKLIKAMGPDVVITGGHMRGRCVDLLHDGKDFYQFFGSKIDTPHTHGSGCVFSTALATLLAKQKDVIKATKSAHDFTRRAITHAYVCGHGAGPVQPGYGVRPRPAGRNPPSNLLP
jgi:hydroxymethylpyrimidine/phosphomethylpyrimidine kinase